MDKMRLPTISIIIPVYNIEDYIVPCLKSLSSQTLSRNLFEVIIVDDCSTDSTFKKASEYHDLENIKIFHNENNLGPGGARNIGIEKAIGEYVLFLDGDDLLIENGLQLLVDQIKKTQSDAIVYNWTYYQDYFIDKKIIPRHQYLGEMSIEKQNIAKHYLAGNMDGSVIYTIVRKSLLFENNIQFPPGYHEDILIIFKIYYCAQCVTELSEIVYIKRDRDFSIMNTFSEKHIEGFLASWNEILDYILVQEGEHKKDNYLPHYYRGINSLLCGLFDRIAINIVSKKKRISLYNYIFTQLQKDKYLDLINIGNFPNVTKKDKRARLFLEYMINQNLPLSKIENF